MRNPSSVGQLIRAVCFVTLPSFASIFYCFPAHAQDAAQKYALMVGVTIYDHAAMNGSEPLKFPEADARAVGQMLSGHGYEVEYLLGPKATRKAILQKLDALSGKGNSSGICVVGFFGHGVEVEFQGAEGKKDIQGCFCPFETAVRQVTDADGNKQFDVNGKPQVEPVPETLVKMSEVVNSLTLAKAGARMLLADCCRDMPNRARGRNLGLGANFSTDRLPGQTVMLFGCRPGERALERDDWKHGAFTKSLLEELTSMAAGPDPVTSGTLADRVKRRVQRLTSNEQNPTPISLDSIDLMLNLRIKTFVNSVGGKMMLIPAGSFLMGSSDSDSDVNAREKPQHRVSLSRDFYMAAHEITVEQFRHFVNDAGYVTEAETGKGFGAGVVAEEGWVDWNNRPNAISREFHWKNPGFSQSDKHPVVNVSWRDACNFCDWLSTKEGRNYRLPTEAEWEYACRAGTLTRYWFGNDYEDVVKYGNVADEALRQSRFGVGKIVFAKGSDQYAFTSPVGIYPANPWGLFDMHGNVWEWCLDSDYDYASGTATDPAGPLNTNSPTAGLFRGGGWMSTPSGSYSARRGTCAVCLRECYAGLGFRVVSVAVE